jgi:hypothetical protein
MEQRSFQDGFVDATRGSRVALDICPPAMRAKVCASLVLLCLPLSTRAQDAPTFDEINANRWALTALGVKHDKGASAASLGILLSSTTQKAIRLPKGISLTELEGAFNALQPCRITYSHNDLSIAAAEHYLYMRMRSADTGDKRYRELPAKYLAMKKEKIADGTVEELQTTSQPVSPPSEDVRRWGELGADHGALDYNRLTGNAASDGVSAYVEGARFVLFAKYRVPETRPCNLQLN